MTDTKYSEKHEIARNGLPEELRSAFDQLVEDYKIAASIHHGKRFVSYAALAEIIRAGWRLTAKPFGSWATKND
jgi:hypothetical protein